MGQIKRSYRQHRLEQANRLLVTIAEHGRHFFLNHRTDAVTRFELDARGRLWLVDHSGERIFSHHPTWSGFSHGGTMRALCEALRDFIRLGTPVPAHHFGPWPEWICGGDLWGYGADMDIVRERARELGIVQVLQPSEATADA